MGHLPKDKDCNELSYSIQPEDTDCNELPYTIQLEPEDKDCNLNSELYDYTGYLILDIPLCSNVVGQVSSSLTLRRLSN